MYVGESTVFQAEVNAITMACQVAQDLPDIRITILSNSQAAILAINKSTVLSRTVYAAIEALTNLAETRFVRLQWVKGHNNSEGNDLADYMAKMGARTSPEGPGPFLPIATIHVKCMAADIMQQRWTRKWALHKHCDQTKIFFPTPDPSRSRDLLSFTRKELGILICHLTIPSQSRESSS
jgi:hypothetical protein